MREKVCTKSFESHLLIRFVWRTDQNLMLKPIIFCFAILGGPTVLHLTNSYKETGPGSTQYPLVIFGAQSNDQRVFAAIRRTPFSHNLPHDASTSQIFLFQSISLDMMLHNISCQQIKPQPDPSASVQPRCTLASAAQIPSSKAHQSPENLATVTRYRKCQGNWPWFHPKIG